MHSWLTRAANAFPLWVVLGGAAALWHPGWFTWFHGGWIVGGLALVMLGMGLTLSFDDFRSTLRMPRAVIFGLVAHYVIMPFLGWTVAHRLRLDPPYAVGLILVACCPCGTASNIVSYLARGHVALSVLLTMCSTFCAVVMTPLLTQWLAGAYVPVDGWGLFWSTFEVVILPVVAGLFLHQFTPRLVARVLPAAPLTAVLTVTLICASIIGQNAAAVRTSGGILLAAVFLLHAGGFALGYGFARIFRYEEIIARTMSIEVGMQNSGLAVVLAQRHFANPLTAVPCAISSVFHSVIGSLLAGFWRWRGTQGV